MQVKMAQMELEALTKQELHALCDRLSTSEAKALEDCVTFFESETRGLWHGRARAMMARRFKHCRLTEKQRTRLMAVILKRLLTGSFSEQFKDQLRLALDLDPERTFAAARNGHNTTVEHVRRYADWILNHKPK